MPARRSRVSASALACCATISPATLEDVNGAGVRAGVIAVAPRNKGRDCQCTVALCLTGDGNYFDWPTVAARNTIETVPARDETRFVANPLNAPFRGSRPMCESRNAAF